MNEKQQILLDKYNSNSLTTQDLKQFKHYMESDEVFQKEVTLHKLMAKVVEVRAKNRFLEGLEKAQKLHQLSMTKEIEAERKVDNLVVSKPAFRKVLIYEKHIVRLTETNRASDKMKLVFPTNEYIVRNQGIEFIFEDVLSHNIDLSIESSQSRVPVIELTIASKRSSYFIDLPIDKFPEGRYYWKLWNALSSDSLMGSFFILH